MTKFHIHTENEVKNKQMKISKWIKINNTFTLNQYSHENVYQIICSKCPPTRAPKTLISPADLWIYHKMGTLAEAVHLSTFLEK